MSPPHESAASQPKRLSLRDEQLIFTIEALGTAAVTLTIASHVVDRMTSPYKQATAHTKELQATGQPMPAKPFIYGYTAVGVLISAPVVAGVLLASATNRARHFWRRHKLGEQGRITEDFRLNTLDMLPETDVTKSKEWLD